MAELTKCMMSLHFSTFKGSYNNTRMASKLQRSTQFCFSQHTMGFQSFICVTVDLQSSSAFTNKYVVPSSQAKWVKFMVKCRMEEPVKIASETQYRFKHPGSVEYVSFYSVKTIMESLLSIKRLCKKTSDALSSC